MYVNSMGSNNTNRMTGLATGLDTDSLVKNMLISEQIKIDKTNQAKQLLEWRQEAYVDIIKDLKDLQDSFLNILSPKDTNMISSSAYIGSEAKIISENTNVVNATAQAGATNGVYEVKVIQLAETAKKQSDFSLRSAITGSINLGDWTDSEIKVTIGDNAQETISLGGAFGSLDDLKNAINTQIESNDNLSDKLSAVVEGDKIRLVSMVKDDVKLEGSPDATLNTTIKSLTTSSTLEDIGITDSDIKITVEGKEVNLSIDKTSTINDFMNTIRSAKITVGGEEKSLTSYIDVGFSELTQKFAIETRETGTSSKLKIEGIAGNLVDKLGLDTAGEISGEDSKASIKAPGETEFTNVINSSNTFTIDNITYNLTDAQNPADESIKIEVKPNASTSVDKFIQFKDKYNALVDKIQTKLTEKKEYNYKPLTDEQKESMEKEDIEAWESKAKQGLLKGDLELSGILNSLRQSFYSTVEGAGITITDIGISTSSNYKEGGKLEIDEEKLKEALETRGDQVLKLFTQSSDVEAEQGIFIKIKNKLINSVGAEGSLIKKAGYENTRWVSSNTLSKNIETKRKSILELQQKLYEKQERYYQMFASLETSMNKLNSQSDWLYSQLGNM